MKARPPIPPGFRPPEILFRTGAILLFAACLVSPVSARSLALVIAGTGGESTYEHRFQDWGTRLRDVLVEGRAHETVTLLTESGKDADGRSDLATVRANLRSLAARITSETDLYIYLIGHGTFRETAKLNLPGPDLSAGELAKALAAAGPRRSVVVNAASTSAAFVNVLSGPDRIICASTRSIDERNATRFAGAFIEALEGGSADQNRDGRISVLEACGQAAILTEASYTAEGYVATEHAILDDNGDRRGTRLLSDTGDRGSAAVDEYAVDGTLAATTYLQDWTFSPEVPADWIAAYRAAMVEVEAHIARKPGLEPKAYYLKLESLLVRAARLHGRIRTVDR